ncbi:MAG TPA: HEAT repeat domain-containing protein [Acidimicrobiales bacterium]|nr:HEAT repeat domain-containing protein [Acidimicrobiales bacterium]
MNGFSWSGCNTSTMAGPRGESPREAVNRLVASRGQSSVIDRCLEVLDAGEVDAEHLVGLSGQHVELVLSDRDGGVEGYWPLVWVLRALTYTWDDAAAPHVIDALSHESWRVREMAQRVIRRQRSRGAFPAVTDLLLDPVKRVRDAATKTLGRT